MQSDRFSFRQRPVPASTGGVDTGPFPSSLVPFEFWAGPFWGPLQPVAIATELLYNEVLIGQPGRQ
jgi:hypothetical protein